MKKREAWQYASIFFILGVASYFYFHNLGTDYITLWDEVVHVNVVKNLADDCCKPKLHLTDIGIDFQDWTNNYIWVHKPLMPLFFQAFFYKIGGESLFAFRLSQAVFALMSAVALFFIARRHFGHIIAITATSLFVFNPYVFELVKGRQFSGLHDLMFGFFGILCLDQILEITKPINRHSTSGDAPKKHYLLFGLFAGLGYLSKGGLAFLFFPALFAASVFAEKNTAPSSPTFDAKSQAGPPSLTMRGIRLLNVLYAMMITLGVIIPEKIALAILYPAEYYFEQKTQVLHLFKTLEYWGRPWDYFFTVYLRDMLLPYLYFPAIAGLVYVTLGFRKDKRFMVIATWVLSFVALLSFGKSKIANFIFAALPGLLLSCVLMFERLWREKKSAIMFSLSATVILSYIIIRFDIWHVKFYLFQQGTAVQRFLVLFYVSLLFFSLWAAHCLLKKRWSTSIVAKTAAVLSLFLILATYARTNQLSDQKIREDDQRQQNIKLAAQAAKRQYPKNSIFILDYQRFPKPHLYFQYWSGLDAMEIYDRQPIFVLKKILPADRPIFIVSERNINRWDAKLVDRRSWGYLYQLNYDN
ncbi:MAG: glycosyltransferase family 39 protein [Candidatus Doudnabacteria bacterium]|nr:glycosyltransferase family 39 protein [Candidatus Doudnabacteria bacterium]